MGFREEHPAYEDWNVPYFDDYQAYDSFEEFKNSSDYRSTISEQTRGIFLGEKVIGDLSRRWKYEATRWLEIGSVIYDPNYWSGGHGTKTLSQWVTDTFAAFPQIERVGLTTWSDNHRMMRAAEKLGFLRESTIRKVRYWQGHYYDSVRYSVLREEWEDQLGQQAQNALLTYPDIMLKFS